MRIRGIRKESIAIHGDRPSIHPITKLVADAEDLRCYVFKTLSTLAEEERSVVHRCLLVKLEKAGLNVRQCLFLLGAAALTTEELTAAEIAALIRYVHLTEPEAMMAVAVPLRELLTGTNQVNAPGLAA